MPLWGSTDAAGNSVISAPALFNKAPTRANANLLYGNTTLNSFVSGEINGVYGVDTTEMKVGTGPVVDGIITFAGSGYRANATVSFTSNNTGSGAVANGQSNATGKIGAINISTNGYQHHQHKHSQVIQQQLQLVTHLIVAGSHLVQTHHSSQTMTL